MSRLHIDCAHYGTYFCRMNSTSYDANDCEAFQPTDGKQQDNRKENVMGEMICARKKCAYCGSTFPQDPTSPLNGYCARCRERSHHDLEDKLKRLQMVATGTALDIEIGKQILLAAADEGAIDNFDDEDFKKVTKKARELLIKE